jgi:hypothetical protein
VSSPIDHRKVPDGIKVPDDWSEISRQIQERGLVVGDVLGVFREKPAAVWPANRGFMARIYWNHVYKKSFTGPFTSPGAFLVCSSDSLFNRGLVCFLQGYKEGDEVWAVKITLVKEKFVIGEVYKEEPDGK